MAVCDIVLKTTPEELCTAAALQENFELIQEAIDAICCLEAGSEIQAITPYRVFVGDDIMLMAMGGDSWSWTGPDSFAGTLQVEEIQDIQLNQSGLYTVVITDSVTECVYNKYIYVEVVEIDFAPTVELTPVGYVPEQDCENASNLNQFIIDDNGDVWFIDLNGCGILLNAACENENINAVTEPIVFIGDTISLFATGGVSYAWTGPDGFVSALQNPTIANADADNTGIYTVVITLANGCTVTKQTSLSVFDDSCTNDDIHISGTPIVCLNDNILLFSNGSGIIARAWSGPGGFVSNLQNPTRAATDINLSGNYTCAILLSNGCTVTRSIYVQVIYCPAPVAGVSLNCEDVPSSS